MVGMHFVALGVVCDGVLFPAGDEESAVVGPFNLTAAVTIERPGATLDLLDKRALSSSGAPRPQVDLVST